MHLLENNEFQLTRADLKALAAFAGRETDRRYIAGVWIDPARSRVFATNGHALAVAQCRGDVVSHEPPRLVPIEELDAAIKHVGGRDALRIAFVGGSGSDATQLPAGDRAVVLTVDGSPRRPPYALPVVHCPDERAPSIDQVIPRIDAATKPRAAWATFSGRQLALAGLVADAVDRDGRRTGSEGAIEFWPAECPLEPAVLLCAGEHVEWSVVIMPCRDTRQPTRVSSDEAIAWAAQIASEEVDGDPHVLEQAWRGAVASLRLSPAEAEAEPTAGGRKRRRRKKTTLRAVSS